MLSSYDPQRSKSRSSARRRPTFSRRGIALAVLVVLAWFGVVVWRRAIPLHGLPSYEEYWLQEHNFPQHNASLPWPEGRGGRFLKFSPYHDIGFNNQLQDILVCAQLAYMSNRAYVWQPYLHHQKKWRRVIEVAPGKWESRTVPLNAIIQGPLAGDRIGPGHTFDGHLAPWEAPRAVSYEFFDLVCPYWLRTYVDAKAVRKKYGLAAESSRNGKAILEAFADHLGAMNDSCIMVEGDHLFTFSDFGPSIVSAFEVMSDSPMLTGFRWSPLVQGVVKRNLPLLADPPTSVLPKKFSGLVAGHLRRGDFEEHCKLLADWGARYNGWNSFPDFPDRHLNEPWNIPNERKFDVYLEHCYPTIDQIVSKLATVRKEWKGQPLTHIYFLTNGEKEFLRELEKGLKADGWKGVHTTYELVVGKEAVEVDMAVDMMIGQMAEVFVGNGFSSLTSNINLLRRGQRALPESIRFW